MAFMDVTAMERRDPASGLIRLGVVLSALEKERRSGLLKVEDEGRTHLVLVSKGHIAGVYFDCDNTLMTGVQQLSSGDSLENLFASIRPKISFNDLPAVRNGYETVTADRVVLHGVASRLDLFDPRPLQERIPVDVLKLERDGLARAMNAGLSPKESEFVLSLHIPTPSAMALWKRGLKPRHAGALIVGLNLLGCFPEWEPGDLPRIPAVSRLLRKMAGDLPPHDILGVSKDASKEEIDRAFRRLSFEIHPDRLGFVSEKEKQGAIKAFELLSAAHAQLKVSRRSPEVRFKPQSPSSDLSSTQGPWIGHLNAAKTAESQGSRRQAQVSALRALSCSPPPDIAVELKRILQSCA
jgi:hypothetical protein